MDICRSYMIFFQVLSILVGLTFFQSWKWVIEEEIGQLEMLNGEQKHRNEIQEQQLESLLQDWKEASDERDLLKSVNTQILTNSYEAEVRLKYCLGNLSQDDKQMSLDEMIQREFDINWELPCDNEEWDICSRFICSEGPECNGRVSENELFRAKIPCCNHLRWFMLLDVTKFLEDNSAQYFLHYETLLGAFRNRSIISRTMDLDLAVKESDLKVLMNDKSLKRKMWNRGYSYFFDDPELKEMGRLCFNRKWRNGILESKWKSPEKDKESYLELFPHLNLHNLQSNNSSGKVETIKGPCGFNRDWIFPLGKVSIFDHSFPAPKDSQKVLSHLYGSKWRDTWVNDAYACEAPKNLEK